MDEIQIKTINTYIKISRFIFHYLIFFVAIIVGLFVFQKIIFQPANTNTFQTNDTLLVQKTKLIAEFNKFLKQNIEENDLSIHILQGDFQIEQ